MFGVFFIAICIALCRESLAEFDQWRYIWLNKDVVFIKANKQALYAVKTNTHLDILRSSQGFDYFHTYIKDVAVNDDFGLWITLPNTHIYYRSGITSSNLLGSTWVLTDGLSTTISSGRQGLVFTTNMHGQVFFRGGITASLPQGNIWNWQVGTSRTRESCSFRVCFSVDTNKNLYTSGLLPNINSPALTSGWIKIATNVLDVSAYGTKTLWKVDGNGAAWEAVDVFDPGFVKVTWERRGYQATKFKDIAVTDRKAYALSNDGQIFVRTGCPIFDFEDDDLSAWPKTGNAFTDQPMVSQNWTDDKLGAKVGHLMIDTFSKRKNYSMSATSSFAGDAPTGTMTSPMFQIPTDYLHFSIGGGSRPNNYVALIVDNSEVLWAHGGSVKKTTPHGYVRTGRFWWDTTAFVNKCAKIKLYDMSTVPWGFTLFDDLRASPPCFKGMKTRWTAKNHGKVITVGQEIVQTLSLSGFNPTKLRMLTITVSIPALNGEPLVYFESVKVTWTRCQSRHKIRVKMSPSSSTRPNKVTSTITGLLSDARIEISARVYDHDALKSGLDTIMSMTINYADEYIKRMTRKMIVERLGNETARLEIQSSIRGYRNYTVGESVTIETVISHNNTISRQRAYNIMLRLNIPPYMTLLAARGPQLSRGDKLFSTTRSEHVIKIRELLLGDKITVTMDVRIDGDAKWSRKMKQRLSGHFLLDVTYCLRENCGKFASDDPQPVWLLKNKSWMFWFAYEKKPKAHVNAFTVLNDTKTSLAFICGPYASLRDKQYPNCYFKTVKSEWMGLGLGLVNVSYYDSVKSVLYGTYTKNSYVKLYGDRFTQKQMLTSQQWSAVVSASSGFVKPVHVVAPKGDNQIAVWSTGGLSLSAANAIASITNLKWRCCY